MQIYQASKQYWETFYTEETISVKKSKVKCYEDNSMKTMHCINDFIAEHLDCQLPWVNYLGSKPLKTCSAHWGKNPQFIQKFTFQNIFFFT